MFWKFVVSTLVLPISLGLEVAAAHTLTPCPLPKYPSFHSKKLGQQNQNKRDTTKITKLANDTDTIATE